MLENELESIFSEERSGIFNEKINDENSNESNAANDSTTKVFKYFSIIIIIPPGYNKQEIFEYEFKQKNKILGQKRRRLQRKKFK